MELPQSLVSHPCFPLHKSNSVMEQGRCYPGYWRNITNRVVQFLGLDCVSQNVVIAGASGDLVSKRSTTMQLTSTHEVADTDYLEAIFHVVHQLVSAPHCPKAVAVRKDP